MNISIPSESLSRQIAEFLKYVGLNKQVVQHEHIDVDHNLTFSVLFTVPISLNASPRENVDAYISNLRESVRNSEEVTRMVQNVVKEKNDLKDKVEYLERKLSELQPFKTHHDIEMELRHGRQQIAVDGTR